MRLRTWLALGALASCCATVAIAATPPARPKAAAKPKARPVLTADGFLPDTAVIARVEGRAIRANEYVRAFFDTEPTFRPDGDSTGRVVFMNTLIDKDLMGLLARKAGYELSFEDRLMMRQHTERVLSNILFQRSVADTIHVSDEQVRHVFEQYSRDLHLRQITFDDPESAEQARKDLASAKLTWQQVAKAHRLPPDTKDAQGDIGWIDREGFDPMLGLDLFDLKPGQTSSVVADGLGYHLFQVVEERPGKHMVYAAARTLIADQIRDRSRALGSRRLKDQVAQGLDMKFDSTNIAYAASHFKPTRRTTTEEGRPNIEFDPSVPTFTPDDTARVLVRYRGGRLTLGDFNRHYSEIPTLMRPSVHTPSLLLNQAEGLVLEPYLARAAAERGLDKDSIAVMAIQKRLDQILVERMYADSISAKVHVTKAARRKYYDEHASRYITWPSVHFAAFYSRKRGGADSLAKRLQAGEKAADILLADSLAGIRRGTIQTRREDAGGPYQKALFEELRPGQVSLEGPDAEGSYLVLQLLAYDAGKQLSFEDADRYVTEAMTNTEEEKVFNRFLARHRREFKIERHPELVTLIRLERPALDAAAGGSPN